MKTSGLLFILLSASSVIHAQSVVPPLDQDGRKGDMARMAHQRAMEKFDQADADKDGKLSPQETAGSLPYMADNFARYDKNKDGFLSWEEYVGHNRWKKE
jgi:hypothetical protein